MFEEGVGSLWRVAVIDGDIGAVIECNYGADAGELRLSCV